MRIWPAFRRSSRARDTQCEPKKVQRQRWCELAQWNKPASGKNDYEAGNAGKEYPKEKAPGAIPVFLSAEKNICEAERIFRAATLPLIKRNLAYESVFNL
jgi:hypothetical protein